MAAAASEGKKTEPVSKGSDTRQYVTLSLWCIDGDEAIRGEYKFCLGFSMDPFQKKDLTGTQLYEYARNKTGNPKRCKEKKCTIIPNHAGANDSGVGIDDVEVESIYQQAQNNKRVSIPCTDDPVKSLMKARSFTTYDGDVVHAWDFLVIFHN
jgi:hypothetical protein